MQTLQCKKTEKYVQIFSTALAAQMPQIAEFQILLLQHCTVGLWSQTINKKILWRFDTIFGFKMMVKSGLDYLYKMSSRWCAIYFRTVMRLRYLYCVWKESAVLLGMAAILKTIWLPSRYFQSIPYELGS